MMAYTREAPPGRGTFFRQGYLFAGQCIFTFKRDAKFFSFFFFRKEGIQKRYLFREKMVYKLGGGGGYALHEVILVQFIAEVITY